MSLKAERAKSKLFARFNYLTENAFTTNARVSYRPNTFCRLA